MLDWHAMIWQHIRREGHASNHHWSALLTAPACFHFLHLLSCGLFLEQVIRRYADPLRALLLLRQNFLLSNQHFYKRKHRVLNRGWELFELTKQALFSCHVLTALSKPFNERIIVFNERFVNTCFEKILTLRIFDVIVHNKGVTV